jgi:site-specific recombinase XerD
MSETSAPKPKELLDLLRDAIRLKHYSPSTEKTYIQWAKRYILFHHKRHPTEMGVPEIEAFLTHLAQAANVSASTQNQAFNALVFLSHNVLHMELDAPLHTVQELLGHRDVRATMIYTHVLNRGPKAVRSPLDSG